MKKYIFAFATLLITVKSIAQFTITNGISFVAAGNVTVSVKDLNMNINGNFNAGMSTFHFHGSLPTSISANSMPTFYKLELAKNTGTILTLNTDITIKNELNFVAGLLELNQKNIILDPTALLINESEISRIIGLNGGEVKITDNLNAPNNINLGNLGATISSANNLGATTIKRGHKTQTGTGLSSAINRYFDILPANNVNLNAMLKLKYFDAELNGISEPDINMLKSDNGGAIWNIETSTNKDANINYVDKTNVNDFSIWTLGTGLVALPITGLELIVKRINNTEVELNWTTMSETNNEGFYIERKQGNELEFSTIGKEKGKSIGDESRSKLQYQITDKNSFEGISYYRIKQVDFNGRYTYSTIKAVKGIENNGKSMKVWPVPALDYLNLSVTGINNQDSILIYNVGGQLIKTISITNQNQVQITGLNSGLYIAKLASDGSINKKIVIQN
ncbi:MAG: T9SS type A sorting domain-containing protein [Bacteroidota bacterium]